MQEGWGDYLVRLQEICTLLSQAGPDVLPPRWDSGGPAWVVKAVVCTCTRSAGIARP